MIHLFYSALEKKLQSGQLSLQEEKKVVADISALNKSKKSFETFTNHETSVENDKRLIEELRAKLKGTDAQRDALKSAGTLLLFL
jgi:uncharacterized coiled-coil DUF342 family protein